jgi:tetratricopeptide (TPR) repeat protein
VDRRPAGNSGFAKKRVQWLIEHSTSHQLLCYVDSLVLRNPLLRKAAKRYFDKAISTKGGELIYMDKVENSFVETGFEYDVKMEEIKFERGIAYYRIDSLNKAFDDFNFSIQKSYLLPDSYYWRGLIYLSYNMKDEGCKDLNKAMELGDPDAKDLWDKNCK